MNDTGLQWMTIDRARDHLRVGLEADEIIASLCSAIPEYVESTTGYQAKALRGCHPSKLAEITALFVLQLWFNPDGTDATQLRRTVDSLLFTLKESVERD